MALLHSHVQLAEPMIDGERAVKQDPDEGLKRFPGLCGGVLDDVKRRSKFYVDDYRTAMRWWSKALSAALFMFFATLFSTVALGTIIQKQTNNRIGLAEYLLMNTLAGVTHALFGGRCHWWGIAEQRGGILLQNVMQQGAHKTHKKRQILAKCN